MVKRRKLQDLYVTGCEVKVSGPEGEEVVWLQKLNPTEQEAVLRRANAARARVLMLRHDKSCEEYQATYSEVCDFGDRDVLINYLIQDDLAELRLSRDAEAAADDEWSKENYLQGLRDSWEGTEDEPGLKDTWLKDPEDIDASRVFKELKRFVDEVDKKMEPEIEILKRDYESLSDDDIIDKVVGLFLENKANAAWMRENTRCELFYAIREAEDHTKRYFDKKDEVDSLPHQVMGQIVAAYMQLKVDPLEGKDSAETDTSSPSSVPPEVVEMGDSSGLQSASR